MFGLSIAQIAKITRGTVCGPLEHPEAEPKRIVLDSREVREGDLFAAFRGERTDGNAYIGQSFAKGAFCCLTDVSPAEEQPGPVILVEDVQSAVETVTEAFRTLVQIPIVGITGSVGKTTAKEMISAVLEQHFRVLKTYRNLNNQLGVPLTITRIEPSHEIAVVEMGVSKIDDMDLLGRLVRPHTGVFTVIGSAHLEFLQDLDGVFREKTKMIDYMDPEAFVVVNGDDPRLRALRSEKKVIRCGVDRGMDVSAENITFPPDGSTCFDIVFAGERIPVRVDSFGKHIVTAALLAAAVGKEYGLSGEEIANGIAAFRNAGRRGELVRCGGMLLLDNCYNANPDSVRSSIDSLMLLPGRHICILADMLELGEQETLLHEEVGRYAKEKGAELLLSCGPLSEHTARGFGSGARHFASSAELIEQLPAILRPGDSILVQASRGMHLETVSDAIKAL